MKRTVFSLLAAFALCVSAAAAGPAVSCPSALLMEKQTGTVLFAQDEHTPREPASVTKIMTLLLVMEAIDSGALSYDDVVTGSAHAAGMGGSQIWLKENEQMTVRDLLKAVCIVSGNDAAVALAEHLDQIADLNDLHGVKADGRLVKDQYFGIADQSLRHTDSLPVTFGKVFDQTILHMVDLDPAADLVDMLLFRDLALFQIVDKPEIALNRHIHVQGRQLGKVSDLLLGFDRVVENIKAVDRN